MSSTTTLNEVTRSPIDGTESVRLATTGANWKATIAAIQAWMLGNAAGVLQGTQTNDSATAGNIGQRVVATVGFQSISSITETNVTSISLTAGDWDVFGVVYFAPAATTTIAEAHIGITSTTAGAVGVGTLARADNYSLQSGGVLINPFTLHAGPARFSLAVTTTVYLVGYVNFGVSTCTTAGQISARRMR